MQVKSLFQPLTARDVSLQNRIVMAPMSRYFSPEGIPGDNVAAYYAKRAKAGVGLIITEGISLDYPIATDMPSIPRLSSEVVPAWKRVVDEVHAEGGVIFSQLWHQGPLRGALTPDATLESQRPSGALGEIGKHSLNNDFVAKAGADTRPMTSEEIADVISAYGRSAALAIEAGFDGVAIHAGHGYLIDSFLWGSTNRRTDQWGGDHRQRTRFAVEVIKAVRAAIGTSRPLQFRFSQHKSQDYLARLAQTPQELEEVLAPLVSAGVDILDVSTRYFDLPAFEGSDLSLAGWTKKLTGQITMAVGSVALSTRLEDSFRTGRSEAKNNIQIVLDRFDAGEFDLIGVGRALIANPDFVTKLKTGEPFTDFRKDMLQTLI